MVFQLDDICSQVSDDDIRKTLLHLPRDLPETFNRALMKILAKSRSRIAQQVFQWTASVKRPLSLEELREAIAIEPCQESTIPDRLLNSPSQIPTWCENLVVIDEEESIVQFAHHSIKEYLLANPLEQPLDAFHVELADADHEVGEICTTYLNFNDFKTQPSRQSRLEASDTASEIAMAAVKQLSPSKTVTKLFQSASSRIVQERSTNQLPMTQVLTNMNRFRPNSRTATPEHPFLEYASQYWLLHTTQFDASRSKSWKLWTRILFNDQALGQTPWTKEEFTSWTQEQFRTGAPQVLEWICVQRHYALLKFLINNAVSRPKKQHLLHHASRAGDLALVEALLRIGQFVPAEMMSALQAAASRGQLYVVEELLAAKTDVNAVSEIPKGCLERQTALQAAAEGGHHDIVERLLAANADVDIAPDEGRTALQIAAESGHSKVVEILLAARADVNAAVAPACSLTALQAAASKGHLNVVEILLAARADVNAAAAKEKSGRTALQAAAEEGHLDIVETLLIAKADVNAAGARNFGLTALQAAAHGGHLDIVERLLMAEADVNAVAVDNQGRTALQAAAEAGHLDVVERLLAAGADVNAAAAGVSGLTALQAAACGGYLEIVERLLAANADINAAAATIGGRTALKAAESHVDVVKRLRLAGAKE